MIACTKASERKREPRIFPATSRLGPHFIHHDKILSATKKELTLQQKNLCGNAEKTQTLLRNNRNEWHEHDQMNQQNTQKISSETILFGLESHVIKM